MRTGDNAGIDFTGLKKEVRPGRAEKGLPVVMEGKRDPFFRRT